MKRMPTNCERIKQLILHSQVDHLSVAELEQLTSHLKECTACRSLYRNMAELANILAVSESELPLPRPGIQAKLLQRFDQIKQAPRLNVRIFWNALTGVLQQPIPLYQTAIALMFTAFVAVYIFNSLHTTKPAPALKTQDTAIQKNVTEYDTYYYPAPYTLPQKLGINAAEDTSFQSILYSAL